MKNRAVKFSPDSFVITPSPTGHWVQTRNLSHIAIQSLHECEYQCTRVPSPSLQYEWVHTIQSVEPTAKPDLFPVVQRAIESEHVNKKANIKGVSVIPTATAGYKKKPWIKKTEKFVGRHERQRTVLTSAGLSIAGLRLNRIAFTAIAMAGFI